MHKPAWKILCEQKLKSDTVLVNEIMSQIASDTRALHYRKAARLASSQKARVIPTKLKFTRVNIDSDSIVIHIHQE